MIRSYLRIIPFELRRRLYSTSVFYGFKRNLSNPLIIKPPGIKLSLRKFHPDDARTLLQPKFFMPPEVIREYVIRQRMLKADIQTCYVSITQKGLPCHMQWMVRAGENEKLQALTRGGLPVIADDEVLLENVFTLESYRRMGIGLWTVKKLFQMASQSGARKAIVFINKNNSLSIKMALRMGFTPYLLKTDKYRLFSRKREFRDFSGAIPHSLGESRMSIRL